MATGLYLIEGMTDGDQEAAMAGAAAMAQEPNFKSSSLENSFSNEILTVVSWVILL